MSYRVFVAEPTEYPLVGKTMGYPSLKAYNHRFKKKPEERAKIFAAELSYAIAMKKEYGNDWKKEVKRVGRPVKPFDKSISSGAKILYQWN